ncbi:TaqI-like C-terminal specificity domain-containing protein [Helicobacter sp. 11S03491-1]|uniref:DUF7149 domain-containing protein n=1 Tax=Helicobacter sp. 11S03491-1 TaxID=1476196 RepID=UPI000BA78A1F|nr:TaqI-like C-terminal specificity domain-containing protein [Helicobacter sp. 11S03491-1]PAF41449.1 hypothetical protein BKH45_06925 [Helicobacter sp. 11S03491-1]
MRYKKLSLEEFLGDYTHKHNPKDQDIQNLKNNIATLLQTNQKESEEHQKNEINNFLTNTFGYCINTRGKIDAAIYKDGKVQVIIEAKSLKNTHQFPPDENTLESKAFYESILYYLRESKTNNNIKHIILCTIHSHYIIEAREFQRLFGQDKQIEIFRKNADDKEGNDTSTERFYSDVAQYLKTKDSEISYTCFKLSKDLDITTLALIFQILSPLCLLKQKIFLDANILNQNFYDELLYILGLEEKTSEGKTIIKPSNTKNSLLDAMTESFSLEREGNYEDIFTLLTIWNNRILFLRLLESMLLSFKHIQKPFLLLETIGDFEVLDILFFDVLAKPYEKRDSIPKSLESIPYLNSSLFDKIQLEKSPNESGKNFRIHLLKSKPLSLYKNSILKKEKEYQNKDSLPLLEYLFAFLHAYDFTTTPQDIKNHTKTNLDKLINAAVLGLVFEKLNGYKEGSFYTPGSITSYMCKRSITQIVLEKFNRAKGWECKDLSELYNKIEDIRDANKIFNTLSICDPAVGSGHFLVSALNELIFIKHKLGILCDEKGYKIKDITLEIIHDEIIIKDSKGNIFQYTLPAHEDIEDHKIQKAIFNAKKDLIEKCLFGVDINQNSCEITKLRLWIELLKCSYYDDISKRYLQTLPNIDINIKCGNSLTSNIDLHITKKSMTVGINKSGSLLANKTESYQKGIINDLENNFQSKIDLYATAVKDYKNETDKDLKQKHKKTIAKCEDFFNDLFKKAHSITLKFINDLEYYAERFGYEGFNVSDNCGVEKEDLKRLQDYIPKFFDEKNSKIPPFGQSSGSDYKQLQELQILMHQYEQLFKTKTFEWRFAFPEVLDENGNFMGFDLVIGNPPYIRQESIKELKPHLQEHFEIYSGTSDIFTYFYEQGYKILKDGGKLSFITSNKWTRSGYGQKLRKFILEKTALEYYVDFNGVKIFDSATVDTSIVGFSKQTKSKNHDFEYLCLQNKPASAQDIQALLPQILNTKSLNETSFTFSDEITLAIKKKIERIGTPLKEWDISINYGIKTGYNDAFIINTAKRDEILSKCDNTPNSNLPFKHINGHYIPATQDQAQKDKDIVYLNEKERTDQIIRPILRGRDIKRYHYEWAGLWVIATFPSLKLDINDYSILKDYLESFMPKIAQSGEKGCRKKTSNQWFETQDNIAYSSEFSRQKIVYPNMAKEFIAFLDKENFMTNQKCFIITEKSDQKDRLLYLSAILNSKTNFWYFKQIGATLGASGYEMSKIFVERLPIPEYSNHKILKNIESLAKQILEIKLKNPKEDTQPQESKMDILIYDLYGLSESEISFIESGISSQEKERERERERAGIINKFYQLFLKEKNFDSKYIGKIIYPETSQGVYFSYDDKGYFLDKTAFMIVSESIDLKLLNGFLSSSLITFYFKSFCGGCILGKSAYQYNKHALEKIPIPKISEQNQTIINKIIDLVNIILDHRSKNIHTNAQEKEINFLVYDLYGLSDEEISLVESLIK